MKYLLLSSALLLLSWLGQAQSITYSDIEPIILSKCAVCHRPGDAAPFSLITYADVAKRASFIKKVVTINYMPPWRADTHYTEFANDRSLSETDKNKLLSWIDQGAPKGTYKEKTNRRQQELLQTTTYGRPPDLTLKIDSALTLQGNNTERFIVLKVPFELTKPKSIEAIEFVTNNKKAIHHINYGFYDVPDSTAALSSGYSYINTTDDPESADKLAVNRSFKNRMVYYSGWIPGTSVESYPASYGWSLPKRGVLIMTVHYSASAIDLRSVVGVNLFFHKEPIKRSVRVISLGSGGIGERDIRPPLIISPNDISTHHLQVKTQEDQSVMYVWPHMHVWGKTYTAYAVTPESDTIRLVHIPQWDFRWQELYKFKRLIKIPRGSVIHMDCTYDNTSANPDNPNNPPQTVFSLGDMDSRHEMMTLLLIYTTYQAGDEQVTLDK
ncbi:cytochrome c [Spirosoma lituiforme]